MIRSLLFMPGNSAGMLLKSDFLGADTVIYDLEDAVSTTFSRATAFSVRTVTPLLQNMPAHTTMENDN